MFIAEWLPGPDQESGDRQLIKCVFTNPEEVLEWTKNHSSYFENNKNPCLLKNPDEQNKDYDYYIGVDFTDHLAYVIGIVYCKEYNKEKSKTNYIEALKQQHLKNQKINEDMRKAFPDLNKKEEE